MRASILAFEAESGVGKIASSDGDYRLLDSNSLFGLNGAISERVIAPEFDIDSSNNSEMKSLKYRLNFEETGTYDLWARCAVTTGKGFSYASGLDGKGGYDNDSIIVLKSLDADPLINANYMRKNGLASAAEKNTFIWLNLLQVYKVDTAGWHTFAIIGSEDGFLIDGFAFISRGETVNYDDLDAALVGRK